MIKYILIGGHIHKAQDGGKAFCDELIKDTDGKQIKILDCLFARPLQEWDTKFQDDKNFFQEHLQNFEIELATPENFFRTSKKIRYHIFSRRRSTSTNVHNCDKWRLGKGIGWKSFSWKLGWS